MSKLSVPVGADDHMQGDPGSSMRSGRVRRLPVSIVRAGLSHCEKAAKAFRKTPRIRVPQFSVDPTPSLGGAGRGSCGVRRSAWKILGDARFAV